MTKTLVNGRAKLTAEQVQTIKDRLGKSESPTALAKELQVSRSAVYDIRYGRAWTDA